MIRVVCGCGRVFKAEDRHTGKRTRCPACGANLIIGQGSTAESGEGELEEVPSWWYPALPPATAGAEPSHPAQVDPEAVSTTVLEHGLAVDAGVPARAPDGPGSPGEAGRSVWPMAGAVAVAVALVVGFASWMRWAAPLSGKVAGLRAPRAGIAAGDSARGPGNAAAPERGPTPPQSDDLALRVFEEGRPSRTPRRLRLLVPAYIYPVGDGLRQWHRLFEAAAKVDVVAILNPENGPGPERKREYAALVAEAADRGLKLVGYVDTQSAERPASEVKADVDKWVRFYPRITGFFLDRQPTDARHAAYMAEIGAYARARFKDREVLVISDPGVPCDESYLVRRAADVVCVFSNFEGFAAFELPANLREFEPAHYAALAYEVEGVDAMRGLLKEAIIKRIGWIYITDTRRPKDPWGRLPTYWEDEVEALTHLQ